MIPGKGLPIFRNPLAEQPQRVPPDFLILHERGAKNGRASIPKPKRLNTAFATVNGGQTFSARIPLHIPATENDPRSPQRKRLKAAQMGRQFRQCLIAGFHGLDCPGKILGFSRRHRVVEAHHKGPLPQLSGFQNDILPLALQAVIPLRKAASAHGRGGFVFREHFLHAGMPESVLPEFQLSCQPRRGPRKPARPQVHGHPGFVLQRIPDRQYVGRRKKDHAPPLDRRRALAGACGMMEQLLDVRPVKVHRRIGGQCLVRARVFKFHPEQLFKERPRIHLDVREAFVGAGQRPVILQNRKPAELRTKSEIRREAPGKLVVRHMVAEFDEITACCSEWRHIHELFPCLMIVSSWASRDSGNGLACQSASGISPVMVSRPRMSGRLGKRVGLTRSRRNGWGVDRVSSTGVES